MNPKDLKYSKTHEWVGLDGGGIAKIGITDHAQDTLGDITFVDLPKIGASLKKEGEAGVIESVKAASDLLTPVTGKVATVNDAIASAPELINSDTYGAGWLYAVELVDPSELDGLMDATAYEIFLETE